MSRKAIIIGAGPAGLTAAYELLKRTDIVPTILEKSGDIGGISKTVNYKGNRIDIGGHRFFSKSDRVMDWWMNIMPIEKQNEGDPTVHYQNKSRKINTTSPQNEGPSDPDQIMLVRRRLSRIYFLRKFFTYPIQLSIDTLRKLGLIRTVRIVISYLLTRLFPRKPEKSLEDFFINRFGRQLYLLFFKDYTEKVWGVSCQKISAEWGAQRVKGISIGKALAHAVNSLKPESRAKVADIHQKGVETSLIERFLYPKFGPGQLWEEVARQVQELGGEIRMNCEVTALHTVDGKIGGLEGYDNQSGEVLRLEGDYFFSTMPVKQLVAGLDGVVPQDIKAIAEGLQYRDFITVGVLLKKLTKEDLKDTWIYIQERDVKVGRLQLFNNWSPYMVKDPCNTWIGMEYFCNDWDSFWNQPDETIKRQAIGELEKMGLARAEDVLDSTVIRMEKTYPAYFGTYHRFDAVRNYLDTYENLFLVGRNGMHKYNNSDHSMLTAMVAVDNIATGVTSKANIWAINTEQEYHEQKKTTEAQTVSKSLPVSSPVQETFKDFLLQRRWNRALLWLAGIAVLVQFIIFKFFYPHAGFINGDSYAYLEAAYLNSSINTYPVGYSNFLRLFSVFTTSDTALVAFQYLLIVAAALYLIFSLFYFYRPRQISRIVLYLFAIFNPVWLYVSNYVSSDALFIALSIIWFTQLIWILERRGNRYLIIQMVLLFYLFTVRYNALYYPVLTTLALLLSRRRIYVKLVGIVGSFLVIGIFMWHTSNRYYKLAGIHEFSPFSGWQMANNAMYGYRYVDSANVKPVPEKFSRLDKMVRHYFDTSRNLNTHPWENLLANTFYMWDPQSPLQQYMKQEFKKDSTAKILKQWATFGPLYAEYGSWLIRNYPRPYFNFYLWPNTMKFYAPPVEFLDSYNMGRDTVAAIGRVWFRLSDTKLKTHTKDLNVTLLDFYPVLAGSFHIVFLFGTLFFGVLHGFSKGSQLGKMILLAGGFWIVNFAFSVLASPVALRFQLFPVIIFFSSSILLLEYIYKLAFVPSAVKLKMPSGDLITDAGGAKLA